jgi:hypothetical protein
MYNASNYPDSTIDTFELLGSKVVSVFWNHVYEKAQALHATGQTKSITDAYKFAAQAYLGYFKNEKLYKRGVTDIYTHFNNYSPVPLLTYAHFVDSVTKEFVPTDYWPGLNQVQKDKILATALENVHKKMSEHMVDPRGLQRVIDGHDQRDNVVFFQNLAVQIMIEERERFYQKFAKPVVGSTSALTERLRGDLVKALAQKKQLAEALQKASIEIKAFTKQVQELEQAKTWLIERARLAEQQRITALDELEALRRAAVGGQATAVASERFEPRPDDAVARPTSPPARARPPTPPQPSYIKQDEFDPYEEIEEQGEAEQVKDVDELAELEAFAAEVEDPSDIKARAKKRRAARNNNVKLEPDDLGF